MGAFQAMPGVIVTTSSAMKCCDGNCVRRWPLTSFAIRTHLYLYDKGKGVCVRDVCAIYDNNISPSLLMIIIKIIILYFIQIRHTDAFPPTGTLLVYIIDETGLCLQDTRSANGEEAVCHTIRLYMTLKLCNFFQSVCQYFSFLPSCLA